MEVELKLLIDSKYKDALLQHPLLTASATPKPREQTLADTYFDTPDLRIRRSDAGLRVRHVDGSWIQNMKRGGFLTQRKLMACSKPLPTRLRNIT